MELFDGNIKKIEAYQKLIDKGIFLKLSDLDIFHGRKGDGSKWSVDPSFDNGADATGNCNVNKIPALNAGSFETAKAFAESRAMIKGGSPEIHKIISINKYAVILNLKPELYKDNEVISAIRELTMPNPTESIDISFSDRTKYKQVINDIWSSNSGVSQLSFCPDPQIETLINRLNYNPKDSDLATKLIRARNSCLYAGSVYEGEVKQSALVYMTSSFLNNNLKLKDFSLSREYLSSFYKANNIIGIAQEVNSATLERDIEAFQFFDLKQINTDAVIGKELNYYANIYNPIAQTLKNNINNENLLKDLNKSPEAIMKFIKEKCPSLKADFEGDIGLWEGFTLEQHTESVLRFFNENFSNCVSEEIAPMIKLLIVAHDIGKKEAKDLNIPRHSPQEFLIYRDKMEKLIVSLGLDKKLQSFVFQFCIYSQIPTTNFYVNNDKFALQELDVCSKKILEGLGVNPSREEITGLSNMSRILQSCDSGAYTFYGKTRVDSNLFHNLSERFSSNFVQTPIGYRFINDSNNPKLIKNNFQDLRIEQ